MFARRPRQFQVVGCFFLTALVACGIPTRESSDWEKRSEHPFTTGPYLIVGGEGKILVALRASLAEPPTVEWWEANVADRHKVVAERDADLWIASLEDLPTGRKLSYRVRYRLPGSKEALVTQVHDFRAGPQAGQPFRFALFGDTRSGHSVHRAVVEAVDRENIDFVVSTGDLVDRGGVKQQWDRFFQIERPLMVDTPLVPAIGNHDWSSRRYFRRYFALSRWAGDRRYYAHDWGNFRLLVVDAGIECREGCTQYAFADRILEEGARKGMLMAISLHFPPYSSGSHGSDKGIRAPVQSLARRHGVELVLAGHDHNYERTKVIDGTTYVVSGSAGAPIRPVHAQRWTAHARTEPHYVLFDVEDDRIVLRAVNLQGETFDSAVISPNPPGKE